jgi:hypothetical protein
MTDSQRINALQDMIFSYLRREYPGLPCGFEVTEEGDLWAGPLSDGYKHPTLRTAIDSTVALKSHDEVVV